MKDRLEVIGPPQEQRFDVGGWLESPFEGESPAH
jgi:hypothetical protein